MYYRDISDKHLLMNYGETQEIIFSLHKWHRKTDSADALRTLEIYVRTREKIENEFISRVDFTSLFKIFNELDIISGGDYETR